MNTPFKPTDWQEYILPCPLLLACNLNNCLIEASRALPHWALVTVILGSSHSPKIKEEGNPSGEASESCIQDMWPHITICHFLCSDPGRDFGGTDKTQHVKESQAYQENVNIT